MALIHLFTLNGDMTDNHKLKDVMVLNKPANFDLGKVTPKSLTFSNNQGYIKNPFIDLTTWSLSFWVKDNGSANWTNILTFSGDKARLEIHSSGKSWTWYTNSTTYGDIISSGTSISTTQTTGKWYHVAITFKNGTTAFYIDGVQKIKQTGKTNFTSGADLLYFGSRIDGQYSSISLNDVRCYNHCLSQREVKLLSQGLVLHYNFQDCKNNMAIGSDENYTYSGFNLASNTITGATDFKTSAETYENLVVKQWSGSSTTNVSGPYFNISSKFGATLVVGKTYTISAYMKADYTTKLTTHMAEGQTVLSSDTVIKANAWRRVYVTFVATRTAYNCCFYSSATATSSNHTIYMCGLQIEEGTKMTNYCNKYDIATINNKCGYGYNGIMSVPNSCSITSDTNIGSKALVNISGDPLAKISTNLNPSFINGTGTVCLWYKKDSSAFNYNNSDFLMLTPSTAGKWFFATQNGAPFNSDSSFSKWYIDGKAGTISRIQDTNWHFYCATGVNLSTWDSLTLHSHGDEQWVYRGYISDFKLFNTVLSDDEIKELYLNKAAIDTEGNVYCEDVVQTDTETFQFPTKEGVIKTPSVLDYNSYEPLEYISFTASQYMKTGVIGEARWEFDMQWTVTGTRQLLGYGGDGSEYWGVQTDGNYGLASWSYMNVQAGNRDNIVHCYDSTGHYLEVNGVRLEMSVTDVSSKEYMLGDINTSGYYLCTFKLYGCKCYRNGVLIRNFVPVKSNGLVPTYGLYEEVEGKFYKQDSGDNFSGALFPYTRIFFQKERFKVKNIYDSMGYSLEKERIDNIPTTLLGEDWDDSIPESLLSDVLLTAVDANGNYEYLYYNADRTDIDTSTFYKRSGKGYIQSETTESGWCKNTSYSGTPHHYVVGGDSYNSSGFAAPNTTWQDTIYISDTYNGLPITEITKNALTSIKCKSIYLSKNINTVSPESISKNSFAIGLDYQNRRIEIFIGRNAKIEFNDSSALNNFFVYHVHKNHVLYSSIPSLTHCLLDKNQTGLYAYDYLVPKLVFPPGITELKDNLCYAHGYSTIDLPSSITTIGNDVFRRSSAPVSKIICRMPKNQNVTIGDGFCSGTMNKNVSNIDVYTDNLCVRNYDWGSSRVATIYPLNFLNYYDLLGYIESTGTQYIDTGYAANTESTYYIDISDFQYSNRIGVFGSSSWNCSLAFYNNTIRYCLPNKACTTEATITDKASGTFYCRPGSVTSDSYIFTEVATSNSGSGSGNITLFRGGGESGFASVKIHEFKITNSSGTVVRHMKPVRRKSDGVLGMYDLINDVFYTNAGTGTFIAPS